VSAEVVALPVPQGRWTRLAAAAERRPRTVVALVMLLSSLAVYLPYLGDFDKIARYWDGPPYMYIAKTLYHVPADHPFVAYDLPHWYFANHLPGYPLLIRLFAVFTLGNYVAAMVLATIVPAVGSAVLFHELLHREKLVESPLWTSILFCFLPPRWLLYHAVGASEPIFYCYVFAAFLFLARDRTGLVIACLGAAAVTRITGVFLVPIFGLVYLLRGQWKRAFAVPLALTGLLAVFTYYWFVYGDFLAYFSWTVDNARLIAPLPFTAYFRKAGEGIHSADLYAWLYLLHGLGTLALWKRRELFVYCAVYWVFFTFTTYKDLPRYLLAFSPFALLIGFDSVLSRRECRFALPLIVFLGYVYAWGLIPRNMVGKAVWESLEIALRQ
jgi:hypothetical protein